MIFTLAWPSSIGYLIDRHPGKQHLYGESVAEHMRMTTFGRTIRPVDVGEGEELTITSLPVGNDALGRAVAAPEEIARVWLRPGWDTPQSLDKVRGKRDVDRGSGLRLVEQKAVAVKARSFQCHRVPDA